MIPITHNRQITLYAEYDRFPTKCKFICASIKGANLIITVGNIIIITKNFTITV